ncbi:hypothetical protein FRB91_002864 [Serendipita sp. 411]|nr:hypothetical protein FRC18_005465 [Serendipita sp. 400]KAG8854974.1 hypothetical protein FRB91_002864 [Serendipita sp. 411]
MKESSLSVAPPLQTIQRKIFIRIGRPGYRVTKIRDPEGSGPDGKRMEGLLVQVYLPQIKDGVIPRRRIMSGWEQKKDVLNRNYQYLIVAAEPYETIAFRIPARKILEKDDYGSEWTWSHWDKDTKQFSFQFMFAE